MSGIFLIVSISCSKHKYLQLFMMFDPWLIIKAKKQRIALSKDILKKWMAIIKLIKRISKIAVFINNRIRVSFSVHQKFCFWHSKTALELSVLKERLYQSFTPGGVSLLYMLDMSEVP